MEPDKKLLIFDFDGVFNRDSMPAYYHAYRTASEEAGMSLDPAEEQRIIDNNWGASLPSILGKLVERWLHTKTPGSSIHRRTAAEYRHLFGKASGLFKEILTEDFPEMIKPVRGSAELLGRLAGKHTLAIDSSGDGEVLVERVMPKLGIDPELFTGGIITPDLLTDDRHAKPDPYTARLLMRNNGSSPDETLFIGDSASDVITALQAQIEPVVPLTGNLDRFEAEELGVEYIIDDVTRLETILGRISVKSSL